MINNTPNHNKKVFLIIVAILSFATYYFIETSKQLVNWQRKIDNSDISDGFALFITINIVKYFLLIFGITSTIFLIVTILKNKYEHRTTT
ncbi:hypothetical protein DS884_17905 [Tenacibaculum sp. E3R01]|uniref:hypothetical protein n=1 Tax=Tenacibaculum sp. E3R01 TaxID=2267227 RepID=UPI000DEA555B|nr:hypothetical protein [Tenacibaculum sp. E3R01]RBW54322.1 hypothetical protein DS884_17905 [Tenacibaculum sp. E3R01]